MKALILLSFFIAALSAQAQNKAPKIIAQDQVGSYGNQVCIDITTTDEDNDSVVIWWNKGVSGYFINNNNATRFASGQVCAMLKRGVQPVGDNFFTIFASDGKDTTTKICNILVRDYPYKVHPVIVKKTYNTFEIDVMGDINEPWNNYIGLTYQSKILDEADNVIHTDTNRVFTFTAPAYQKYRLYTTYKTSTPDLYSSLDTLYPDMNVGINGVENAGFSIYPNPATHTLYLQNLPQDVAAIQAYDIIGKQTEVTITNNAVDISQLDNGLYQIVLVGKDGEVLAKQRFIKSR